MADDNLALLCEATEAVRAMTKLEHAFSIVELKLDMSRVLVVARSLEDAVNQLAVVTDVTERCVETLIST